MKRFAQIWLALLVVALPASAQTLRITRAGGVGSLATGTSAGPDFATDVLGDPWDFEQATDHVAMFEADDADASARTSSWTAVPTVANGVLTGVSRAAGPVVRMQWEGIAGALNSAGRPGGRAPRAAATYTRLSFRGRRSAMPSDGMSLTWYTSTSWTAGTVGGYVFPARGVQHLGGSYGYRYVNQSPTAEQGTATRWHIFKVDLPVVAGSPVWWGANWSSVVRGLRIKLGDAIAGKTVDLDWVRLTQTGVAVAQLSFSGFGGAVTVTARHQETGDTIQIFPDNGTTTTTFADNSTYTWDYGFLPPGTWQVTAARNAVTSTSTIVVDPPAVLTISEPNAAGGKDFARTIIGDAWDLTNVQDATRYGRLNQIDSPSYASDGLHGTTRGTGGPAPTDPYQFVSGCLSMGICDAFVQFIDENKPTAPRIDASLYHNLSFTLEYDHPELMYGDVFSNTWGGIARVIWQRTDQPVGNYTNSQDIVVVDGGPQDFTIDLAQLSNTGPFGEPGLETTSYPWAGLIQGFRIDVTESWVPRGFRLSNVRLAADDEPNQSGFFTIRWNVSDATFARQVASAAGGDASVALYWDTDTDKTNGRTRIASGIGAAAGQYVWNTAALARNARVWISMDVTDSAGNTQTRYSSGPLRTPATALSVTDNDNDGMADSWEAAYGVSSPGGDEDGDGVDNLTEYRQGTHPLLPNTWTLPEGATGFFQEQLALANPDTQPAAVTITYLRDGAAPIVRDYTVDGMGRLTIDVNSIAGLESTGVSAVVTANAGGVLAERTMFWDATRYGGHTGKALKAPRTEWYLAEGAQGFFDTFVLLSNATSQTAAVTIDYILDTGAPLTETYTVGPQKRKTIYADDVLKLATSAHGPLWGKSFSAHITSNVPIGVERAMYFSSGNRFYNGGHEAAAVEAPATSWFVAEGRTGPAFDMFLLLANPNGFPVDATVRYLKPGGQVVTQTFTGANQLKANSRQTIWVDTVTGVEDTEVSASVTASNPIIVERAMYWPDISQGWVEAHASAGVTGTGSSWLLAEGEHMGALGFQTYLLIANPSASAASVRITALRTGAPPLVLGPFNVPANSRATKSSFDFAGLGLQPGEKFGVLVESTNGTPIVVERAMYWDGAGEHWSGGSNETGYRIR